LGKSRADALFPVKVNPKEIIEKRLDLLGI
jgi:hypothetical protein